jgi:hypothetical protein
MVSKYQKLVPVLDTLILLMMKKKLMLEIEVRILKEDLTAGMK